MKYRIANPNEDLGTHPLNRLRESFATEESAQGVSVEADGQWHALWPWLQEHADPSAQSAAQGFRSPFIVPVLRACSGVFLGWGILSLFGPWPEFGRDAVAASALWVASAALDLLARIEFNTRR
jgi:hypothetical protein